MHNNVYLYESIVVNISIWVLGEFPRGELRGGLKEVSKVSGNPSFPSKLIETAVYDNLVFQKG